ncbi:MAG: DUF1700 domain-containing protein [Bacillota bacterium]|nr:DUF1700 domain-containing protein [Bacillota bacterium]
MNKESFLRQLEKKLAFLPQSEIKRTLNFYEESIDDRVEDGMSEEEAVASIERADIIAERILQEQSSLCTVKKEKETQRPPRKAERDPSRWIITLCLLILGFPLWLPLLIVLATVSLCIYLLLWMLIIALAALLLAAALIFLSCLVSAFAFIPHSGLVSLFFFGLTMIMAALGILSWFAIYYGCKALALLGKKLANSLRHGFRSLFRRKEKNQHEKI